MVAHSPIVLVTGGSGFIGSSLADELLRQNYTVRVLDNLETGYVQYLDLGNPQLEVVIGDIQDMSVVRRCMERVDAVVHIAAASKVAPSLKDPSMATFNICSNVLGTANILEAAANVGTVSRFVYAASSTYYGNQPVPFIESSPHVSSSPYASSKYMGELLCNMYDKLYKLPIINLRLFMVYGPRQPKTGDYAVVTGKFIEKLSRGEPLTIEGTGNNFRDFVHVNDVVNGIMLALNSKEHAVTINIGSGKSYSVKDVADLVCDAQVHVPERPHDLKGTLADISLANTLLGYTPQYDFVEETLKMKRDSKNNHANQFWLHPEVQRKLSEMFQGWEVMSFDDQNLCLKKYIKANGITQLQRDLQSHI